MLKILLLCRVPSPFLVELAEEANKSNREINFDIWFSEGLTPHRGKHWFPDLNRNYVYFGQKIESHIIPISLMNLISEKGKYDVILSGLSLSPKHYKIIKSALKGLSIPLIHWSEPPINQLWVIKKIKEIVYRYIANRINLISVFAIGLRSYEEYSRILKRPTHIVPYFQKLPYDKNKSYIENINNKKTLSFLFSGQLISRNNMDEILYAIKLLNARGYSESFRLTLYGDGPLKNNILKYIKDNNLFNVQISGFKPDSWDDRLKPYVETDVLLCPALYSGWGLTIPEALAMGIPVISSYKVESARYFLKEGSNGFLTTPDALSIANVMEYFINNPKSLFDMKNACVESSKAGSIEYGCDTIERLLKVLLKS